MQQIEGEIDIRSDAGVTVTISFPDLPPQGTASSGLLAGADAPVAVAVEPQVLCQECHA
ncbi:hypothetical protein [Methylobacterium sp. WSM2598]|uniref:hypothetical protein n=1 Tax=Methylobacterium sp. WSM2598 TaxID=398261 RepID=UPI0018DF6F13|nr:hypothetical protein [Methylobacterium sp. WSM2598]